MKMSELMNLWRNALRIRSNDKDKFRHSQADKIIRKINEEWERRGKMPRNPEGYFDWPGTDAKSGLGGIQTENWLKTGLLNFMGYKVGETDGEPRHVRQRILTEIFSGPLPPVFEQSYLEKWADPSSAGRLHQLAETIAALTRNAKRRRDAKMNAAIRDWEADLEFLHDEYYVGKFRFGWPTSSV